ncbi:MAG: hypothetical protein R2822_15190 [Spirosomataceae bacterium]
MAFKAYSFQVLLKTAAFWALQNILGPIFTDNPAWAAKINIISTNSTTIGMSVFLLAALAIDKLLNGFVLHFYFLFRYNDYQHSHLYELSVVLVKGHFL